MFVTRPSPLFTLFTNIQSILCSLPLDQPTLFSFRSRQSGELHATTCQLLTDMYRYVYTSNEKQSSITNPLRFGNILGHDADTSSRLLLFEIVTGQVSQVSDHICGSVTPTI